MPPVPIPPVFPEVPIGKSSVIWATTKRSLVHRHILNTLIDIYFKAEESFVFKDGAY